MSSVSSNLLFLAWLCAVSYSGGLNPSGLTIALIVLLAIGLRDLIWIQTKKTPRIWKPSTTDLIMLAWLCWLLLSLPLGILPAVSTQVALSIASLPIAYGVFRLRLALGTSDRVLITPLWLAACWPLFTAVAEFLTTRSRPFATFEDANALAAFWNILFFPSYLQFLCRLNQDVLPKYQISQITWLVLLLAAIAFSTSLGGQLCFVGGLVLTLMVTPRGRSKWTIFFCTVFLFIITASFASTYSGGSRELSNRFSDPNQNPFTERLAMTRSALQAYDDQPWYGAGLGTYKILYPMYRSTEDRSTTGDLAHNDYVQFLLEGGPILSFLLLGLASLIAWKLFQVRKSSRLNTPQQYDLIGALIAISCALVHASMNFIFYVLPLTMSLGMLLARVEHLRPSGYNTRALIGIRISFAVIISTCLLGFVLLTLGMRSVFVEVALNHCELRACRSARLAEKPVITMANLLAATQPTWLPARDYIVARLRDEAERQRDPEKRAHFRVLAAQETISIIKDTPDVYYLYATLADLILETPSIKKIIPADMPSSPIELYSLALARRPQDQDIRLKLAQQIDVGGNVQLAFDIVDTEGMKWWRNALVSDTQRMAMLRFMLPRAIRLGKCDEARRMGRSLLIYAPTSQLARLALNIDDKQIDSQACGVVGDLPAE